MKILTLNILRIVLIIGVCGCESGEKAESDHPESLCALLGPKEARIIGGESCSQNSSPVVMLTLLDEEGNPSLCSGTMITTTRILTAAHCFNEFTFDGYIEFDGVRVRVSSYTLHPNARFNGAVFTDDIAIATLENPVAVTPAKLPTMGELAIGDELIIYGYGNSQIGRYGDSSTSGRLHGGTMTISAIGEDHIVAVYDDTRGQNPCFGDSGGPAFTVQANKLVLAGVISSGSNDTCGPGDESVFTNLYSSSVAQFIDEMGRLEKRAGRGILLKQSRYSDQISNSMLIAYQVDNTGETASDRSNR